MQCCTAEYHLCWRYCFVTLCWVSLRRVSFCFVLFDWMFKRKLNWSVCKLNVVSHCDIITFRLGSSLLGSTFVFILHFGAKTILSQSHFEDDSSPHISGSSSSIRIDLMFVLFKHIIVRLINYLETWLRSDNTSCYYSSYAECQCTECYAHLLLLSWVSVPLH